MKYLKEKLFRIYVFSSGVFIPQQLYDRPEDRKNFFMLKKRHPHAFSIVEQVWSEKRHHRTSIHFLKSNVAANNQNQPSKITIPPYQKILSQLLWTELILQWGASQEFTFDPIWAHNEWIQIDTFNDEFVPRAQTTLILSTKFRRDHLENLTSKKIFVPKSLSGKWTDQVITQFFQEWGQQKKRPEQTFHPDKREYPGLHEKLTGPEKWELDQFYLKTKKSLPPHYQMGVQ